jgi:hypothetical protein
LQPLQDKRVIIGQNVSLECQVNGHPEPVTKWLKDGQNVTQCPDYTASFIFHFYNWIRVQLSQIGNRHILTIKNVQASDGGHFTMQAMNAAGTKQTSSVLIVAPAPTPVPGAKTA